MERKAKSILVGVMLLAVGLVAPAYGASTKVVQPGESIQEAIDAAKAGDTIVVRPGEYVESLWIKTEGIKLLGSGAVLKPPAEVPKTACNEGPFVVGVCVVEEPNKQTSATSKLANVTVNGFTIQGFGMGVFGLATHNLQVSHNTFRKNQTYGAFAIDSTRARFLYNSALDSGFAAYYIGESPQADAIVQGNSAQGSDIGLFYRAVQGARVVHNVFSGNCVGVVVAGDPTPAGDLMLTHNEIYENNRVCETGEEEDDEGNAGEEGYEEEEETEQAPEEEPTISGVGILLLGPQKVVVRANNVWGNEPSGEADVAGGIVVMTDPFTRAVPSDILVTRNRSFDNKPADLVWDETGTAIQFVDNQCVTSQPPGLC